MKKTRILFDRFNNNQNFYMSEISMTNLKLVHTVFYLFAYYTCFTNVNYKFNNIGVKTKSHNFLLLVFKKLFFFLILFVSYLQRL